MARGGDMYNILLGLMQRQKEKGGMGKLQKWQSCIPTDLDG
jgi:hypothetical protein